MPSMPSGTSLPLPLPWPLRIAISAVALHGAQAAHAAVLLEAAAFVQHHLARRFVQPGQQAAQHHHVRPGDDGLDDVAADT